MVTDSINTSLPVSSLGYKPFLHQIRGEIEMLSKLVEASARNLSLDVTTASEAQSVEEGNLSPGVQSIRSDIDTIIDEQENSSRQKSDCIIS